LTKTKRKTLTVFPSNATSNKKTVQTQATPKPNE
jgi:hypothetical protein